MTISSVSHTDYDAIKARQRDTWASGDYATIGTTLQIVGETLSEAVDIAAGERVLGRIGYPVERLAAPPGT